MPIWSIVPAHVGSPPAPELEAPLALLDDEAEPPAPDDVEELETAVDVPAPPDVPLPPWLPHAVRTSAMTPKIGRALRVFVRFFMTLVGASSQGALGVAHQLQKLMSSQPPNDAD